MDRPLRQPPRPSDGRHGLQQRQADGRPQRRPRRGDARPWHLDDRSSLIEQFREEAAAVAAASFLYRNPTRLRRTPIPSTSASITSPDFKNSGGFLAKPTPSGVPVATIVPAGTVMPFETHSITESTGGIMSRVLPSCLVSPFTLSSKRSDEGSSSSRVTMYGPVGQKPSRLLPLKYWPPQPIWMSRALT